MNYKESFYDALAKWLRDYYELDAVRVTNFKEDVESGGYCETCWYDETVVYVDFLNSKGIETSYRYYGSMADLIRELCNE
ncbi:hypothetical protein [Actinomadura sp. WMMB 499]|uniref:hypothetical protein n=1 Tax=Actinomadura sp. WMMB 499 TaxID=1219491 RepID=UPI00124416FB|nr:hypothetical protein [Actinomadura sp. WMMB 499]QFG25477.1 hypothetical protein F7P10_34370 [Actinomadura sp. WMMB 499]